MAGEPNLYSLEHAQEEGAQIRDLAGEQVNGKWKDGTASEYQLAYETISGEPLERYQGFDPGFYKSSRWNPEGEINEQDEAEIEGYAEQYREILSREDIKAVLKGEMKASELPDDVIWRLSQLTRSETLYSDTLPFKASREPGRQLLKEVGIEGEWNDVWRLGNKSQVHLYRMMMPIQDYDSFRGSGLKQKGLDPKNSICKNFARKLLKYAADMPQMSDEDLKKFEAVIGSEGASVRAFWTLAPYLFDELKAESLSENEALDIISDMIREAATLNERGYVDLIRTETRGFNIYSSRAGFNLEHSYVLGIDERMPSHLITRLISKRIVEQLKSDGKLRGDADVTAA